MAPLAIGVMSPIATARARWLLAIAAVPTVVTWSLEFAGVLPFSNLARFVAGLPLGAAAAWLVLSQFTHRPSPIVHRQSPIARRH